MESKLFPFPNRDDSRQILENDPCYGKIPQENTGKIFDEAWEFGRNQGLLFSKNNNADIDMVSFLRANGFSVIEHDVDYVSGNIRYFCEYVSEKNIVEIYRKSIILWSENNKMTYQDSLDIILAHEYFHYLEWHVLGRVSKHYLVPMLKLGRLCIGKTGISALSEIAANAFANTVYEEFKKAGRFTSKENDFLDTTNYGCCNSASGEPVSERKLEAIG